MLYLNKVRDGVAFFILIFIVIPSAGKGKSDGANEESPDKRVSTSKKEIPRSTLPTGQHSARNDNNKKNETIKEKMTVRKYRFSDKLLWIIGSKIKNNQTIK